MCVHVWNYFFNFKNIPYFSSWSRGKRFSLSSWITLLLIKLPNMPSQMAACDSHDQKKTRPSIMLVFAKSLSDFDGDYKLKM